MLPSTKREKDGDGAWGAVLEEGQALSLGSVRFDMSDTHPHGDAE